MRKLNRRDNRSRLNCDWCGVRILDSTGGAIQWDRFRTEEEYEKAKKKEKVFLEAKERVMELVVKWKPGAPVREYAWLCNDCLRRIAVCERCASIASEPSGRFHECRTASPSGIDPASAPSVSATFWCDEWRQREPYTEEEMELMLPKEEKE